MNENRTRCANFTTQEQGVLLSLVEKYWNVIDSKKIDSEMLNEKRKTWEKIRKEFVKISGVSRETTHLKRKYDNLKKLARKDLTLQREFEKRDDNDPNLKDIQFDKKELENLFKLNSIKSKDSTNKIYDETLDQFESYYIDGAEKQEDLLEDKDNELMKADDLIINMRKLVKLQKVFYKNEEIRAREKHMWEKAKNDAKLKLLKLEIEIKSKQLENM